MPAGCGTAYTEARDWWGMRGWFTPGFGFVDDPKFPRHKDAAFEIRDMFSDERECRAGGPRR